MNRSLENTYCNPIVLPQYPSLGLCAEQAPHFSGFGPNTILEYQLFAELGCPPRAPHTRSPLVRPCEQDVRATADPSPYYFEGKWWLYPTCGVIYSSEDLVHWQAHDEPTWRPISAPMAPTVEKVGAWYVACANMLPVYVSQTPAGPWECIGEWQLPDGRGLRAGDVMIFTDDDGRSYLYFGLGFVIAGAEIDPTQPNRLLTMPKILIQFNPRHRWERFGACNEDWGKGMLEGSWMLKHGGRYYLVYSCAGTQYASYAMGCYLSDSPLGDFAPQEKNPVSLCRQGLVTGGGHGGFVKGPGDTLWVFYTIPVCVDDDMERRVGMDPAGFDENGNLFALTGCEVPQWAPGVLQHPEKGNAAPLVPLTRAKPTQASSYAPGQRPMYATDEALATWWQPAADDAQPVLTVDLRGQYRVSAVRLLWKDIGLDLGRGVGPGPYRYVVEGYDGDAWRTLVDAAENSVDLTVDYRTFPTVGCTMVRLRILGAPAGITPGLLDFTAFGESCGKPGCEF